MPQGLDFSAVQTQVYDFTMPGGVAYHLSEAIPFAVVARSITVLGRLGEIQQQGQAGQLTSATAQQAIDEWSAEVEQLALDIFHATPAYAGITAAELRATGCDTPIQLAIVNFFSSRLGTRYASLQAVTAPLPTPVAATTSN